MKNLRVVLKPLALLYVIMGCQSNKPEKALIPAPKGKIGLIGYGSLTSQESIEQQLRHVYNDSLYSVHLMGFRREWNFSGSNSDPDLPEELLHYDSFYLKGQDTIPFQKTIFLNIMPDSSQKLNCVLYFIDQQEVALIDKMELGYERIDVSDAILEYSIKGAPVYAYKAKPGYEYHPEADSSISIIDKEYAELVFNAYDRLGKKARAEFDASTDPLPQNLLAPVVRIKR